MINKFVKFNTASIISPIKAALTICGKKSYFSLLKHKQLVIVEFYSDYTLRVVLRTVELRVIAIEFIVGNSSKKFLITNGKIKSTTTSEIKIINNNEYKTQYKYTRDKIINKTNFLNGKQHGNNVDYFVFPEASRIYYFEHGLIKKYTTYYRNGQVFKRGKIIDNLNGQMETFNMDGSRSKITQSVNGVTTTTRF